MDYLKERLIYMIIIMECSPNCNLPNHLSTYLPSVPYLPILTSTPTTSVEVKTLKEEEVERDTRWREKARQKEKEVERNGARE